jgi:hypothetical protein
LRPRNSISSFIVIWSAIHKAREVGTDYFLMEELQKNIREAGGMGQVVECLPGKHKALRSNPGTARSPPDEEKGEGEEGGGGEGDGDGGEKKTYWRRHIGREQKLRTLLQYPTCSSKNIA